MKFQYFKADFTTTIEEAKRQYRKLALKLHPDMGGSEEEMKRLNSEWDYLRSHNFNIHETANGSVYTDWQQDVPDDVTDRFADIIDQLIHMEGLTIEVCGSFLWIGGTTRDHKDSLKAMGMRWAPKKHLWYLAPKDWKKKTRRELTMSEIRETYGSTFVGTGRTANPMLTA